MTLPPPPAHVAPYVEALGAEMAVDFLCRFGGAEVHIAADPKGRGAIAREMGQEVAAALGRAADRLPRRVPTAKPWLARCLQARGLRVAEIARRLHVTDVTVRSYLGADRPRRGSPDPRQLPLI